MKPAAPRRAIDHLFGLATRLPWWGGLLLALAAYTLLHAIAVLQLPTPAGMVDVAATALGQLLVLVARIGQYLVPLTFLVAAAVSGFDSWKRGELRESVALDTTGSVLRHLSWTGFELVVADSFRRRGYEVRAPHADSQPRERALELIGNGGRFLVDCTDWRSWKAGAAPVRGLHERIKEAGAAGGFAITSGQFTPEAKHFAADKDIELIDGRRLKELVRAEPQPTEGSPSLVLAKIRSALDRCKESIAAVGRESRREMPSREPGVWSSPGQVPEAGIRTARGTTTTEPANADDAEMAAGRQLTALIRAERGVEEEIELSAPPVQSNRANPPRPRMKWPRLRARKIADAVGIALALAFLWGVYVRFLQLPATPADTPWALLGAGSDSKALARRLQGLGRTRSATEILEGKRPLGQYRFGPPPGFLSLAQPRIAAPVEPVVVYHSLRELEVAFDAKYVPPPECYAHQSNGAFVKCGNHRIRARRTFIDSGGKVTAALLGSWEEPRESVMELRPRDWRETDPDAWQQDGSREWRQAPVEQPALEPQGGWGQEWAQGSGQDSGQDWQREWARQPAQDPAPVPAPVPVQAPTQDWRQDPAQGSAQDRRGNWRDDWQSGPLPVERRHWVDDY